MSDIDPPTLVIRPRRTAKHIRRPEPPSTTPIDTIHHPNPFDPLTHLTNNDPPAHETTLAANDTHDDSRKRSRPPPPHDALGSPPPPPRHRLKIKHHVAHPSPLPTTLVHTTPNSSLSPCATPRIAGLAAPPYKQTQPHPTHHSNHQHHPDLGTNHPTSSPTPSHAPNPDGTLTLTITSPPTARHRKHTATARLLADNTRPAAKHPGATSGKRRATSPPDTRSQKIKNTAQHDKGTSNCSPAAQPAPRGKKSSAHNTCTTCTTHNTRHIPRSTHGKSNTHNARAVHNLHSP